MALLGQIKSLNYFNSNPKFAKKSKNDLFDPKKR